MNINKIPVSEIFYSQVGTTNTLKVELPQVFHQEAKLAEGQKIQITGMKIEDAVCFFVENQVLDISYNCVRCLKPSKKKINLLSLEKHFYVNTPEDVDVDLVGLIDKKNFDVDISPFLEELILLSLPTLLICGKNCTGMPTFTTNSAETNSTTQNPFSNLKDLLK